MKLSVIIVNYNVKFYVEQCLYSLFRATQGIETEVFVVDNHSRDGSVEFLSQRFHDVNIIASNHNLGFARANNLAIKQCSGEYVLLLNPDTIVGEESIRRVVDFMDAHPNAGGAGVRMVKTDGSDAMESRRGLPTPITSFYKMSGLCARFPHSRRFARYYLGHLSWDEPAKIEVISGAFCMLRHTALDKVGLLDEDFFMYGEDVDLSYRILKGGFDNWYVPVRILHYKGESTQKSSFRYVHVFYEAMFIFFKKHYSHISLIFCALIRFAILLKASVELVRMQAGKVRRNLGFYNRNELRTPLYIFIGSAQSVEQCRQIARRKGVEAKFYEGDSTSRPDGHQSIALPDNEYVNVVYDVEAYTYDQIFGIFARGVQPHVTIGTYNPHTRTIITEGDILK